MTIAIRPTVAGSFKAPTALRSARPAEIWDIPSSGVRMAEGTSVRTLHAHVRTPERSRFERVSVENSGFEREGVRQDVRAGVLLGTLAGFALLVGSSIGGVFADGENAYAPVDTTREVIHAELR